MDFTEVFVWGNGESGQLGQGRQERGLASPRFCSFSILITGISCGSEHSCFISSKGHIYSMGSNSEGKLGLGDRSVSHSTSPFLVASLLPYFMSSISCGSDHTMALSTEGQVFTWGSDDHGELGTGVLRSQWSPVLLESLENIQKIDAGAKKSAALAQEGRGYVWGKGFSSTPSALPRKDKIDDLILGEKTILLVLQNRQLVEMDENLKDTGVIIDGVKKAAAGFVSACIKDNGQLLLWGFESSEREPVSLFDDALDVQIGGKFIGVLDSQHKLFTWGENLKGELGHGNFKEKRTPALVQSLEDKTICKISLGKDFSICLGKDIYGSRQEEPPQQILQPKADTSKPYEDALKSKEFPRKAEEVPKKEMPSFKNQGNTSKTEDFRYEKDSLFKEYTALKSQVRSLTSKLEANEFDIKTELSNKLATTREELAYTKNSFTLQVWELEGLLEKKDTEYKRLEQEKAITSSHNKRLEKAFEESEKTVSELKAMIQKLTTENSHQQSLLVSSGNEVKDLKLKTERQNQEILHLKSSNEESFNKNRSLESLLNESNQQNSILKGNAEHLNYQLERSSQELLESRNENSSIRKIMKELEHRQEQIMKDNQILHNENNELEEKNKELFESLQRELEVRAREYRERTMSVLNTPLRRKRVEPSPSRLNSYSLSKYKDAPSGLLEVLHQHSPPYISSPSRHL